MPPPPPPPPLPEQGADAAAGAQDGGQTNKKRSFAADYIGGFSFLFAASFLTWYIMRQKRAADRRVALAEGLEDGAAICPGEIKELREVNSVRCAVVHRWTPVTHSALRVCLCDDAW